MRTITALLLVLTAAASIFILPRLVPPASPSPVIIHSQGPTVQTLQRLSHLVTTKVLIADILVGEGKGCRGSWLLKGDAILAVELAQAKVTDKHEDTKQATIILPEPVVLQPRIDHSRTRTWSVERVAWLPWSADQDALRDAVYAEGQKLVAQTAASAENIQQAKTTAEVVLRSLYAEVGWSLEVRWASAPSKDPKASPSSQ